ncbi:MAG: CHASE2 domain-containing protein, partial [Verrucomicrobia bacterium]|nr:CHASE2 domain-containing protein [Verrucomicrobiota bacterium]
MKLKRFKPVPVFLTLLVLAAVCGLRLARLNFFTQLENITYDARMRAALHFPAQTATNLAFVFMDESSIRAVQDGSVGFHFGLYWPREVYGRVVAELAQQRAKAAAFDVLFKDLRPDHPLVEMTDGSFIHSDGYFALQLRRAHNVILADTGDATLPDLFTTNALALGDASTDNDSDGRLRRARAFTDYRRWNPLFQHAAAEYGLDLDGAKIEPGKIILPQIGTTNVVVVPVDAQDDFAVANFIGTNLPPGMAATARAFTMQRVWQMGIVLAAQALHLDLAHARVDLARGQIVLSGRGGVQ